MEKQEIGINEKNISREIENEFRSIIKNGDYILNFHCLSDNIISYQFYDILELLVNYKAGKNNLSNSAVTFLEDNEKYRDIAMREFDFEKVYNQYKKIEY